MILVAILPVCGLIVRIRVVSKMLSEVLQLSMVWELVDVRCSKAAITTPAQTTALLGLCAPKTLVKMQLRAQQNMRQVTDLQRMPRCKRTFAKRYARTNTMGSTLDDRRNDRPEKSKLHTQRLTNTHKKSSKKGSRAGATNTSGARPNTIGNSGTTKHTWAPMFLHVFALCLCEDIESLCFDHLVEIQLPALTRAAPPSQQRRAHCST